MKPRASSSAAFHIREEKPTRTGGDKTEQKQIFQRNSISSSLYCIVQRPPPRRKPLSVIKCAARRFVVPSAPRCQAGNKNIPSGRIQASSSVSLFAAQKGQLLYQACLPPALLLPPLPGGMSIPCIWGRGSTRPGMSGSMFLELGRAAGVFIIS